MPHHSSIILAVCALCVSCERPDAKRPAHSTAADRPLQPIAAHSCTAPKDGLVITLERVAQFPTTAPLSELERLCSAGDTTLYDAVGWQAPGREFPFPGARITAVQSMFGLGPLQMDAPPDLWVATGDSLRLSDGRLVPRTLGELRARYGRAIADDNVDPNADDFPGFGARSCRFPYIEFKLAFSGRGVIPDSTRITGLDMSVPPPSWTDRICDR
jgi:hypothetical protein